jgi:hypothetical protein
MHFKQWLLTEASAEDFFRLALLQRDKPEKAMIKFQFLCPGIMSSAVEHIGDLIHRMTEKPTFSSAGYEFVKDKVNKTLRWLTNEYGFSKEFNDNIIGNANYKKIPVSQYREQVLQTLQLYAQEHAKLPVYNKAQELARLAAVSLGNLKYNITINALQELKSHLNSLDEWVAFAHEGL